MRSLCDSELCISSLDVVRLVLQIVAGRGRVPEKINMKRHYIHTKLGRYGPSFLSAHVYKSTEALLLLGKMTIFYDLFKAEGAKYRVVRSFRILMGNEKSAASPTHRTCYHLITLEPPTSDWLSIRIGGG